MINNGLNRFKKDALIYVLAVTVPALIGVFSLSLYTRIFSTQQFGKYNLVLITSLFITTLFSQWIQQAIQRYRPEYKNKNRLREFNANLTVLLLVVIIVIFILGIVLAGAQSFYISYQKYYVAAFLLIISQFLFLTLGETMQSDFKVRQFKNFNLINAVSKIVVGILLIYYVNPHPSSIIYGLVISQFLLVIPMVKENELGLTIVQYTNISSFYSFLKKFFKYGFPMIGWFIGNTVLNLSDRYMLELFETSKAVGIYSANYSIVSSGLGLLTIPLLNAAHPIIMNMSHKHSENKKEIENTISFFSKVYLTISVPLIFCVLIFHKEIATILLGPEFREGSIIIPILFIGTTAWNLAMYGHKGFEIMEKTKIMLFFVVISAVINVILNFILIPKYSYIGAAFSTMISMFIYPILIFVFSGKFIKWKLPYGSVIKIIFGAFCSMLVSLLLKPYIFGQVLLELIVGGLIYILVYLTILILTKELPIKQIKKILKI
ncbi:polysaccharide biosynthesis C-terminal domain-containing protein [Priestia sp. FSL W8-0524]|uniref:lipopolysaccharide biosynthesis protein n=1 Tax=Priestia sp. FSL W8-0524 TaxID=2954625 RepID=UPI0030F94088